MQNFGFNEKCSDYSESIKEYASIHIDPTKTQITSFTHNWVDTANIKLVRNGERIEIKDIPFEPGSEHYCFRRCQKNNRFDDFAYFTVNKYN